MTLQTDDRATIADLEAYGLSLRVINGLEDCFDFLYVDELAGLTEDQMLSESWGRSNVLGPGGIQELRTALQNFVDGRRLKTPAECAAFGGAKKRKKTKR